MYNRLTKKKTLLALGRFRLTTSPAEILVLVGLPVSLVLLFVLSSVPFPPTPTKLRNFASGAPAQSELMQFYARVELGMPEAMLRQTFLDSQSTQLTLKDSNICTGSLIVMTPLQMFAKNWLLSIQLVDGKVAGLYIRTHDSGNEHPKNAPADKILPGIAPCPELAIANG